MLGVRKYGDVRLEPVNVRLELSARRGDGSAVGKDDLIGRLIKAESRDLIKARIDCRSNHEQKVYDTKCGNPYYPLDFWLFFALRLEHQEEKGKGAKGSFSTDVVSFLGNRLPSRSPEYCPLFYP